jgi:imidazolonepropionase-like amidohydrolase
VGQAQLLHAAGVPAEDALAAASWAARTYLGPPGIEHAAPADPAIYASDPRTGLETLHDPELIVLAGRVIPATHRS